MAFKSTSGLIVLATMFATASLSSALPISLREFDDFEAMDLEARQGALSCYPVDVNQIKTLPAWGKIEKYAKDTWGDGGWNIVTNPSEYPDRPLQVCVKASKVTTQFTEKPQCTTDRKNIAGQSTGTASEFTFTTKKGTVQTSTWTVTRSSTIASSVKFTLNVGVPAMPPTGSVETSMSAEVKNERSSTFTGTVNNEESLMMKFTNAPGQQCKVELVTQTCTATGSGRVPTLADGFVWFNYKDKRAPKADPNGSKHFKYAANLNKILSEAERTTFIEFQGPINSKSTSTYNTHCADIGKPLPLTAAKGATATKGTTATKGAAVKTASKPTTGKKAAPATKKVTTGKKTTTKATPAKKPAAKSAPAKKSTTKSTPAKKPAAKTTPAAKKPATDAE